jgi:hypothetical protein
MAIDLSGGLPVEREYVFAERPGPEMRDACNIWVEEANGAFAMRIGVEALAEEWDAHEIWLDIAFPDGRVLSARERGPTHPAIGPEGRPTILGAGPLAIRCVEPFKLWTATLQPHPVTEISAAQLIADSYPEAPPVRTVAFEIAIAPAVPPLVSGTLTAESRDAMSGEQGSFISPRYEQLCRATGHLTIDGNRVDFTGQALRIKRQGVRRFEGFWGHCWQSALFPSGRAFGVNAFPPRSDGELIPARAVESPWLRRLQTHGDDVPLVLETADGRRFTIEGTTFINTRSRGHSVLPPSFPLVQQAHARYRWDGEEATGMIERSTLRDAMDP